MVAVAPTKLGERARQGARLGEELRACVAALCGTWSPLDGITAQLQILLLEHLGEAVGLCFKRGWLLNLVQTRPELLGEK